MEKTDLRSAMNRRLKLRVVSHGEITMPAVPGMVDDYVTLCEETFTAIGVTFNDEELAHLRGVLESQLAEAYQASPRSEIVLRYESPIGSAVSYRVTPRWSSLGETYDNWVATREPPLFGSEPDARVCALAAESGAPAQCPVLDIGAGTGRNSLALARRGHPVDAVELSGRFAEILAAEAREGALDVRVLCRDVFETLDDLRRDYRLILLSEVVSDFRSADELRRLFELAAQCLAPGGNLLFNAFLPRGSYIPDEAARQLGQQCYTTIFTYGELSASAAGLPVYRVADDSVHDYERAYLPADAWPPTSWYSDWTSGRDVFDLPREQCPIEMRWLVYRKFGV